MTCALWGQEGAPPVVRKDGTWSGPLRFFGVLCWGYGCCLESGHGPRFSDQGQGGSPQWWGGL